jgi:hypothetical protein
MEAKKTAENRNLIEKEAEFIVKYVKDFQIYSAKDDAAIREILIELTDLHVRIDRIEESHQRRIILMREMAKTINAMEEDHKQFATKYKQASG